MNERVYLDWNATAPVRQEAREAYMEALERFGNPSSVHAEGRAAKDTLEKSRETMAGFMGCLPSEVYFTSGGFEANNIALSSLAENAAAKSFASSKIEHGSIMGRLESLAAEGWTPHWMKVSPEGLIDPYSIDEQVGFACFQAMNQETGALHDIEVFCQRCDAMNVPWHCDAVQLWGRGYFSLSRYSCTTSSLTGHKLGAPKGTGVLFVRKTMAAKPLFLSGPQERSLRPGTENIPGIAALAAAAKAASEDMEGYRGRCSALREMLVGEIVRIYPKAVVNGPREAQRRVPNTLSVSFPGIDGSLLVHALDLEGVATSSGSACHSGASKPSPVLTAMELPPEVASSALRISMGWQTGEDDVRRFLASLAIVLARVEGGGAVC